MAKPRFVKKSELTSSKSELSSDDNKASLSVVEEVNGDQEENKGSEVLESKIEENGEGIEGESQNGADSEVLESKIEENGEGTEGDESQNGADDVVSRLEKLRLRMEEPDDVAG